VPTEEAKMTFLIGFSVEVGFMKASFKTLTLSIIDSV
jgi:hypothetical protein